jgi:hypothetical protein
MTWRPARDEYGDDTWGQSKIGSSDLVETVTPHWRNSSTLADESECGCGVIDTSPFLADCTASIGEAVQSRPESCAPWKF